MLTLPQQIGANRQSWPDVPARGLSRSAMLAISRAIEDEAVASADGAIFVGAFQTAKSFRSAQRRWRHLSRTADIAIALASFPRVRHTGVSWEAAVSSTVPISREWAVICESPRFSACPIGVDGQGTPAPTARRQSRAHLQHDLADQPNLRLRGFARADPSPQLSAEARPSTGTAGVFAERSVWAHARQSAIGERRLVPVRRPCS